MNAEEAREKALEAREEIDKIEALIKAAAEQGKGFIQCDPITFGTIEWLKKNGYYYHQTNKWTLINWTVPPKQEH